MAGIEPASERIDQQISTSVVSWSFCSYTRQPTKL